MRMKNVFMRMSEYAPFFVEVERNCYKEDLMLEKPGAHCSGRIHKHSHICNFTFCNRNEYTLIRTFWDGGGSPIDNNVFDLGLTCLFFGGGTCKIRYR